MKFKRKLFFRCILNSLDKNYICSNVTIIHTGENRRNLKRETIPLNFLIIEREIAKIINKQTKIIPA